MRSQINKNIKTNQIKYAYGKLNKGPLQGQYETLTSFEARKFFCERTFVFSEKFITWFKNVLIKKTIYCKRHSLI